MEDFGDLNLSKNEYENNGATILQQAPVLLLLYQIFQFDLLAKILPEHLINQAFHFESPGFIGENKICL